MAQPMPRAVADPAEGTAGATAFEPTRAAHAANELDTDQAALEPGLSRRAAEFSIAAILFLLAILVIWDNQRIGAGWTDTGPAPGYFPMRLGIVLALCAVVAFITALREKSNEQFASWAQLKRVAQVLIPLTVYIALIGPLGIYVASMLFIAAFMVFAGRYPIWKGVALGVATNLLMFFVFEIQFKVPLPKGPLEAMFGY